MFGALLAAGCSTGNNSSGLNLVDAQGRHPQNFVSTHPPRRFRTAESARIATGTISGRISNVSCWLPKRGRLHANGPAFHPGSWLNKTTWPGFHGTAYTANALIRGLSCLACHEPSTPSYNCLECHFNEGGTQRVPTGSAYVHGSIGGHAAFGPLDAPNATTSA
jgi:hypothetical protein